MGRYDSKLKKSENSAVPTSVCVGCQSSCFLTSCKGTCSLNCKGTASSRPASNVESIEMSKTY